MRQLEIGNSKVQIGHCGPLVRVQQLAIALAQAQRGSVHRDWRQAAVFLRRHQVPPNRRQTQATHRTRLGLIGALGAAAGRQADLCARLMQDLAVFFRGGGIQVAFKNDGAAAKQSVDFARLHFKQLLQARFHVVQSMTQHDIAPEDHVKCLWLHSSPFYLFTLSPWISFTLALTPVTLAIVFVVIAAKRRDVKGSLGYYNTLSTWERPFSRHN